LIPYPNGVPWGREAAEAATGGATPDRPPLADGAAFLDEDENRGLEGVLGVLRVREGAAANAVDERPVPAEQRGERGLVAPAGEPLQ
jgi:hypothetical protein